MITLKLTPKQFQNIQDALTARASELVEALNNCEDDVTQAEIETALDETAEVDALLSKVSKS
jgi:uncharacterized protein YukE